MALVIAEVEALQLLVPPVAALIGVGLGALLPYVLEPRREARRLYDAAITAVTRSQSTRHGVGLNIPPQYLKPAKSGDEAKVAHELSTEAVRRWLETAAEARAALAALQPWSPDLQRYWDQFEITPDQFDELINVLTERRRRPTKRHALLPRG